MACVVPPPAPAGTGTGTTGGTGTGGAGTGGTGTGGTGTGTGDNAVLPGLHVRPAFAVPAFGEPAPDEPTPNKVGPTVTADAFISIDGKAGNVRKEQVQQFEILIEGTDPDDPDLPDLLFRLAELHAQSSRYWTSRANELYATIEASDDNKAALEKKQKGYFEAAKTSLLDAVKAYKRVADNPKFSDYPRIDEALFHYAFTLQRAQYNKEARQVFHRLIKDYPDSTYIPEAYLAFADYYFEQNSLANAERFYDKVLQFPRSSVYNYALYKKGWVYYRLDQPADALETFYKVADRTQNGAKYASLSAAAKHDFVLAYAEVGKPSKARATFERLDKQNALTMVQLLLDIYVAFGTHERAIETADLLLELDPSGAMACEWTAAAATAAVAIGTAELIDVRVLALATARKTAGANAMPRCVAATRYIIGTTARARHAEAASTSSTAGMDAALGLYDLYVDAASDATDRAETRYIAAELAWHRAAAETDATRAQSLWTATAARFDAAIAEPGLDPELATAATEAARLARENAERVTAL